MQHSPFVGDKEEINLCAEGKVQTAKFKEDVRKRNADKRKKMQQTGNKGNGSDKSSSSSDSDGKGEPDNGRKSVPKKKVPAKKPKGTKKSADGDNDSAGSEDQSQSASGEGSLDVETGKTKKKTVRGLAAKRSAAGGKGKPAEEAKPGESGGKGSSNEADHEEDVEKDHADAGHPGNLGEPAVGIGHHQLWYCPKYTLPKHHEVPQKSRPKTQRIMTLPGEHLPKSWWDKVLQDMRKCTTYQALEHYWKQGHFRLDFVLNLPDTIFNMRFTKDVRDDFSAALLHHSEPPVQGAFPVHVKGDDACFFNSVSRLIWGDQEHATELRVRFIVEAIRNKEMYLSHQHLMKRHDREQGTSQDFPNNEAGHLLSKSLDPKEVPVPESIKGTSDASLIDSTLRQPKVMTAAYHKLVMNAVASKVTGHAVVMHFPIMAGVLRRPVQSFLPHDKRDANYLVEENLPYNRIYYPFDEDDCLKQPATIMWTCIPSEHPPDPETFNFNHFVPLVE